MSSAIHELGSAWRLCKGRSGSNGHLLSRKVVGQKKRISHLLWRIFYFIWDLRLFLFGSGLTHTQKLSARNWHGQCEELQEKKRTSMNRIETDNSLVTDVLQLIELIFFLYSLFYLLLCMSMLWNNFFFGSSLWVSMVKVLTIYSAFLLK